MTRTVNRLIASLALVAGVGMASAFALAASPLPGAAQPTRSVAAARADAHSPTPPRAAQPGKRSRRALAYRMPYFSFQPRS